jgi:hypothetical protein
VLQQVTPSPSATPPTPVAAETRLAEASESRSFDAAEVRASSPPPEAAPQAAPPPSTMPATAASSAPARAADTDESSARARTTPDVALAKAERFDSRTLASRSAMEESGTPSAQDAQPISGAAVPQAGAGGEPAANEMNIDVRANPDTWMAYIARLRHVGRSDEADRELADFRRAFPHYKYSAPAEAIAPNR